MKTLEEIKEFIFDSNFDSLYFLINTNDETKKYISCLDCFSNEIDNVIEWVVVLIKEIAVDEQGYELENFSINTGKGEISRYIHFENNSETVEIRLSDHNDKHGVGNRKHVDITDKNVKELFYNEIINALKEVKILK